MIGWLVVGWLVDWLVVWLVGWLVCWLVVWLVGCWSVGWVFFGWLLVGWLVGWLLDGCWLVGDPSLDSDPVILRMNK